MLRTFKAGLRAMGRHCPDSVQLLWSDAICMHLTYIVVQAGCYDLCLDSSRRAYCFGCAFSSDLQQAEAEVHRKLVSYSRNSANAAGWQKWMCV